MRKISSYITERTIYVLMKLWWYPLFTTPKRFVVFLECSLKQESAGRHAAPYWHISLIPSQPVPVLTPLCCLLSREATHTHVLVFGLTRLCSNSQSTEVEAGKLTTTPPLLSHKNWKWDHFDIFNLLFKFYSKQCKHMTKYIYTYWNFVIIDTVLSLQIHLQRWIDTVNRKCQRHTICCGQIYAAAS